MNILHIAPYYPSLNANHAGGVCMGKECETLSEIGVLYVLAYVQNENEEKLKADGGRQNIIPFKISRADKVMNALFHPFMPSLFGVRSSKKYFNKLCEIIENKKIDVVHFEYCQMGQYIEKIKKLYPHIQTGLVLHDVVQQSYKRQYAEAKGIKRLYLGWQLRLIKKYEKQYIYDSNKVFVFCEKDKKLLQEYYGYNDAIVLNVYFNLEKEFNEKIQPPSNSDGINISYFGQMSRKENIDAALRLIRLYEKIRTDKTKLYIIGSNPPKELTEMATEDIIVTGFVEDADDYLKKTTIAVFPLAVGAGIKIKVLHTMALGIPVVTSSVGAEGIDEQGAYLHLAETDEEFCNAMQNIIRDKKNNFSRAAEGRIYIKEHFGWDVSDENLKNAYRNIL